MNSPFSHQSCDKTLVNGPFLRSSLVRSSEHMIIEPFCFYLMPKLCMSTDQFHTYSKTACIIFESLLRMESRGIWHQIGPDGMWRSKVCQLHHSKNKSTLLHGHFGMLHCESASFHMDEFWQNGLHLVAGFILSSLEFIWQKLLELTKMEKGRRVKLP